MHSSVRALFRPIVTSISELIMWLFRGIYRDRPVPLSSVVLFDKILPGTNPLMPPPRKQYGNALRHERLAEVLREEPLGEWAAGAESLNFLQALIERRSPGFVLELGSGISTVCLARYVADIVGLESRRPLVCSIEQDESQAARTRSLLELNGLSAHARVVVAPLVKQRVFDVETTCFAATDIVAALEGRSPELVFIDGPSGPPGVRLASLPNVLHGLQGEAWFILDDAFRTAEIEIARRWAKMSEVSIDGVIFVDKGLLLARARPPRVRT